VGGVKPIDYKQQTTKTPEGVFVLFNQSQSGLTNNHLKSHRQRL